MLLKIVDKDGVVTKLQKHSLPFVLPEGGRFLLIGQDGNTLEDVPQNLIQNCAIDELRILRNLKLKETDWTQLPDAPLTDQQKADFSNYRQSLRDMPENIDYDLAFNDGGFLDESNIIWPTKPE